MQIVSIVVQALLGLGFLMSGSLKIVGVKQSLEQRDHLRVAPWFWRFTGLVEVVGALLVFVGIWLHVLALAGGALLGATMIGAVLTHVLNKDAFARYVPAIILFVLAIVVIVLQLPNVTSITL